MVVSSPSLELYICGGATPDIYVSKAYPTTFTAVRHLGGICYHAVSFSFRRSPHTARQELTGA